MTVLNHECVLNESNTHFAWEPAIILVRDYEIPIRDYEIPVKVTRRMLASCRLLYFYVKHDAKIQFYEKWVLHLLAIDEYSQLSFEDG